MKIGIVKETFPGERRVAIVPQNVADLKKLGLDVVIESGAGSGASISDMGYAETAAMINEIPDELIAEAIVENKDKEYFGMYPINKKVEEWLKKEFGIQE